MARKKRQRNDLMGIARGQVGASVTLGGGSMALQKMGYSQTGVTAMGGYMPVASSLAMGTHLIKKVKPRKKKRRR